MVPLATEPISIEYEEVMVFFFPHIEKFLLLYSIRQKIVFKFLHHTVLFSSQAAYLDCKGMV